MTPKSMTLSKLKQSELKRFDKKYSLGINEYSPFWSEDIKKHLLSAIDKAYSLGKAEGNKKINRYIFTIDAFNYDNKINAFKEHNKIKVEANNSLTAMTKARRIVLKDYYNILDIKKI